MSPDIHTLSGAYVLDAIDPDERAAFEEHLAECEACRDEVAALQTAAVALAPSEAPPVALRAKVLAAAERTPQLPPVASRPAPAVRRAWAPRLLAAAAAVIVLGGVGVVVREATQDNPPAITASEVFGSSDARVKSIALTGGKVRVGVSKKLGLLAVDGADLPPLTGGRVYQLWLVDDGLATSLAVMDHSTSAVEKIPASGSLAVTAEPEGGSKSPTSAPIVTVDPSDL
jgi:anti-sigma-K factor RskA